MLVRFIDTRESPVPTPEITIGQISKRNDGISRVTVPRISTVPHLNSFQRSSIFFWEPFRD